MGGSQPAVEAITRIRTGLSREAAGGVLLLAAAAFALLWANSPWSAGYFALTRATFGPAEFDLHLTLTRWAAEGLLAIFFFVVGLELKHELVLGSLRKPTEAVLPVCAAFGAMALPLTVYLAIVTMAGVPSSLAGWAIPMATDLVFGLAVLAVFGRGLPIVLRTFLLALAVVTNLVAILFVAVLSADRLHLLALVPALVAVELSRRIWASRRPRWWLVVPLAFTAWVCVLVSGIHASVIGVLLSFAVPALPIHGEPSGRVLRVERRLRPWANLLVLPVFAFLTAGVPLIGRNASSLDVGLVLALSAALSLGTVVGVLGMTAVLTRFTRLRLPSGVGLRDLLPVGLLAGIGFSVSLLFTEFTLTGELHDSAKLGTILGSLAAAILAAVTLRWDASKARSRDMNRDGFDDRHFPAIGTDEVLDLLLESERAASRR